MIELNKKAKPYHVCEELLGTELFNIFNETSLVGSRYICPENVTPKSDWDVLCCARVLWHEVEKLIIPVLIDYGFKKEGNYGGIHDAFVSFRKGDVNLILTNDLYFFKQFKMAAEVCKLVKAVDKDLRIQIHDLIMEKGSAKMTNWNKPASMKFHDFAGAQIFMQQEVPAEPNEL